MKTLPSGAIEVFLAIAEHGSLRAAAAALGVQPPAISQRLKAIESAIGVDLFVRTTRSVRLTEAGRALLQRARPALADLAEALEAARGIGNARNGTVRITLPYRAFQLVIAPRLADFQATYPDIELELSFNEALVDIVVEGFHAGIRLGDRVHEDMIAARLTPPLRGAYFAAPPYLERHGRPRRPEDLLRHDCIRYRQVQSRQIAEWQFTGPGGIYSVAVKGRLVLDSFDCVVMAALAGLGIGWSLREGVREELESGRLVSLLDRYVVERPGFFVYYPKAHARLWALRTLVDFFRARA